MAVSWVVDEVAALVAEHEPAAVVVDGAGQSQSLIAPLERAGVEVTSDRTSGEMAAACGGFHDAVLERTPRASRPGRLDNAVEGSRQHVLGDAWAWSRRSSSGRTCSARGGQLGPLGVVVHGDRSLQYVF